MASTFLGWRIQRHRKRGTGKSYVYVYPAKKALAAIMAKAKAFCRQSINLPLKVLLIQLNRMLRGWTAYFKYGCSNATFSYLRSYLWKQVVRWQERKHRRTPWKELRRRYGIWPTDGGVGVVRPGQSQREALLLPGNEDRATMAEHSMRRNARPAGACGAPGALRGARRVREAIRGNPPMATPAGRPGSTSLVRVEVRDLRC